MLNEIVHELCRDSGEIKGVSQSNIATSVGNRLDFHNQSSVWPNQSTIDCIIDNRSIDHCRDM